MNSVWSLTTAVGCCLWAVACATSAAAIDSAVANDTAIDDAASRLAARIDHHISARWEAAGAQPAQGADDAEFLRRVTLDLAGRIPAAGEVRSFLADDAPDKRRRTVDELLDGAAFARHWSTVLTADWVPQASDPVADRFQLWLEGQFRARTPYDRVVRTLLTADPGSQQTDQAAAGARGFLVANDFKPENLAASTARQFFGLNLDCAQCHNHPFARWTQEQFWEFAAFFADVQTPGAPPADQLARIAIPQTEKTVAARFPDGGQPQWQPGDDPRLRLVEWMTAEQTPYFARNAANRLWAYFLGTGLIEPLDDLSGAVPPSHPELLNELAAAFVSSGYNVRFMVRAITTSKAYQLSSAAGASTATDPQMFARMPLRPLSADQLLASFLIATGLPAPTESERQEFLTRFRITDRRAEPESSVLQALARMNGSLTLTATRNDRGPTLTAVTNAPLGDAENRIDAIYLATLSRLPAPDERIAMAAHVAAAPDSAAGLADLFWVLLNSAEFGLNH